MQDGPKRQGRFLKKGSSVLKNVSLVDFKFQEMVTTNSLTHDNSKRSIILVNCHDKELLDGSLRKHDKMDRDLISPEDRPPIITPTDFTAEWEKERTLRKRKIARFEDDDDYDLEMDAFNNSPQEKSDPQPSGISNDHNNKVHASSNTKKPLEQVIDQAPTTWETMDAVGKAINNLQSKESSKPFSITSDRADLTNNPSIDSSIDKIQSDNSLDSQSLEKIYPYENPSEGFTSVLPQHEEVALRNYQRQQHELAKMKQEFEAELSQILAEEKARAYKDGFQLGEEKAEQQSRERTQDLFKNIGQLVSELTQLKSSILSNVQENFYTICQAIGEALVKREFSIHPETFAEVLRGAIAETVQPTNLKILVHPEMFDKLMGIELPDIKSFLAKDSSLEISGFRLESHLSVIDGSISAMIEKMLKQADIEIFEKQNENKNSERRSA